MKKVLFLMLCCAIFAVGCSKAVEEQPAATENMDQTAAVSNDVTTSTDTVAAANVATSTATL